MYNYRRAKTLRERSAKANYVPDDLEKINKIIDGTDPEHAKEEYENYDESIDDELFKNLDKAIHDKKEIQNSTNYRIMTEYLSKLKKTVNGKRTDPALRLNIVRQLLENDTHFIDLTEKLFACTTSGKYFLLPKLVEFPLECMSSYIQGVTNSNKYLRRKYYDGQVRKRKDGSIYQRESNISTEADLIRVGEDGEEFSPYEMAKSYDKYFDEIEDIISVLNDDEKQVALCLNDLSTYQKRATIKEIVEYTRFTKRQVETLIMKIKIKVLKWLYDSGLRDTYIEYYAVCQKSKDFEKKYKNYLKKCEKITS